MAATRRLLDQHCLAALVEAMSDDQPLDLAGAFPDPVDAQLAKEALGDRKVVHGKVAMAKLYASEMAGRVADRAVQIFGGRGYMHDTAAARFYRELRVDRIWEGTSEIQRLIIARGLAKRGPEPYLGWE